MLRIPGALVLAGCLLATAATPAFAHKGDPNYEAKIDAITPAQPGLKVTTIGDGDVQVVNDTGRTVTIYGYQKEPYARLFADGRLQVNRRSPATYLNVDNTGTAPVPKYADPDAAPVWQDRDDGNGRFTFHDHRTHWMGEGTPPQVKDKAVRTKVYDWTIPVAVGAQRAAVDGTLFWRGQGGGAPVTAIVALAIVALLAVALVVVVRRRRSAAADPDAGRDDGAAEAW